MKNEIVMSLITVILALMSYIFGQGAYIAFKYKNNRIPGIWCAIESVALGVIVVCCIVAMFLGKGGCSGVMILLFKIAVTFLMAGVVLFLVSTFDDVRKYGAELVSWRIERTSKRKKRHR